MYRRDKTGPVDDLDALRGDPWTVGNIHDRPNQPGFQDELDMAIAQRREELLMQAQQVYGPQEHWAPITESEVYRAIDDAIREDLSRLTTAGPHASMSDDFIGQGNPFEHGHTLPMSKENELRYAPQSEREEAAVRDQLARGLWEKFSEAYPWIEPDEAERASMAVGAEYEARGTTLVRELQLRGADAVLSDIYGATRSQPQTYSSNDHLTDQHDSDGRTAGFDYGRGAGGQRVQRQEDEPGDMIADLQRMRPKWV
jgi:hypothetical protein